MRNFIAESAGAASRRELPPCQELAARPRSHAIAPAQIIRSVIAFSTARVRSRVPSFSRMVET